MPKKPFAPPVTISRPDFLRAGNDAWFRGTIYSLTEAVSSLGVCRVAFGRYLRLSQSQFVVLMGVAQLQEYEGVTIRMLAEHISLAQTHTTTEVGRLVRRKLLIKKPSPIDGRSVSVTLTPDGEEAVQRIAPLLRRINDLLFQKISPKELEVVRRFSSMINLNAQFALAELENEMVETMKSRGSWKKKAAPVFGRVAGAKLILALLRRKPLVVDPLISPLLA